MTRIKRNSKFATKPTDNLQFCIDKFNKAAPKPRPRKLESELQRTCVKWFRLQYPNLSKLLFAVPNGGSRNVIEASRLKDEGVTAGVADLILMMPSANGQHHGLCIEMKTTAKGSRQSDTQKEFQTAIEPQGYRYVMPRTLEEFQYAITKYLK